MAQQNCPHCHSLQNEDQFIGKSGRPTKLCLSCRRKAAESMKLSHARRKMGIIPPRGRPSLDGVHLPVRAVFTIPRDLLPEVETYVRDLVDEYLRKHGASIPAGTEFGIAAAPPPQGSRQGRKTEPRASRSNSIGAVSPEHHAFVEACDPAFAKKVATLSRQLFDMRFDQWIKAGKPNDWKGLQRKRSSLAAPPPKDS